MSTTRPYPPGDRGPESGDGGASAVSGTGSGIDSVSGTGTATGTGSATATGAGATGTGTGTGTGPGRQARRLSFDGQSGVVPLARDFARQALHAWGWLPAATADRRAAAEDVLLVVSELVTNACLHAEGPEELRIACDNKVLRVEVSDRGAGQPAPRTPHRAGRPGGHGMFIVQRLCLDWGVVRTPGGVGKTVWAELGAPA
ncbi:ATP-binding protein [Streptomyces sp. NBC_00038]|uniref:ATP-binding protein n=1 Tax=Streptomyces sp. NBC_00038 TaxID=2903615 RepID=UPI00225BF267|nr:ATP-binding protein [Streptomyces sp. NBC_00038]MCX5558224.1 ATP-binding protein [Streptomyces sp. NBC_00038]